MGVYKRRENLRLFFGFKEEADTEEHAREVLVGFLKTELCLEKADQVEFQRVHRVGKRVFSNGKPRQIIARFLKYPHREEVMSNAGKLKGKNVGISPVKNISEAIESMENYSYQYNIKLVGFPELYEHESANDTAKLFLEIFKAIGASELTVQDIDIAHCVQSRSDTGPKPIICKFVRRLAKENVMNHRREVESISPSTLGYSSETSLEQAKIYDHLTPRLQHLLSEANKFKTAHQFQYCWAKNGQILLRKTHESRVIKLKSVEDLSRLTNSLELE